MENSSTENSTFNSSSSRPIIKLLTYDGTTPWKTYKTQFSMVAEANCWDNKTRAYQLAASLRGDAAEILESVPEEDRQNFDALKNALEMRYGETFSKDLSRLHLKTRHQKPTEDLQVFAADIDRLSHAAFLGCPEETREDLAVQYFVDGIRDQELQKALRMMDFKNLKDALNYAKKFEIAQMSIRKERHPVRAVNLQTCDSTLDQILARIQDLEKKMRGEKRTVSRSRVTCWNCGLDGHIRRNCPEQESGVETNMPNKYQGN